MSIAVVVPTVRPECWEMFKNAWTSLFLKHHVHLIKIQDGNNPILTCSDDPLRQLNIKDVLGKNGELIFNRNDGVRNLGFAYIAKHLPEVTTIITLDDDTLPVGDPIQDHLDTLNKRFPISWMSTASEYMRGVPYKIRNEAECVVSHGVWNGVKDYDAPSQLVNGNPDVTFYKGAIPRGVYFPFCGMNMAFKRKMLPYMYYAPMGYKVGLDRFADIWLGINLKRKCDENGWAIATGFSTVQHDRASNVWTNLKKEVAGLALNETYWQGVEDDPYFKLYNKCRKEWEKLCTKLLS